jgi:hypothetical protein
VGPPDRYDPLPALPEIPGWLWRRTSRAARVGLAVALALAIVAAAIAISRAGDARTDANTRAAQERAQQRASLKHRLEAEQRPVAGSTAPARTLPARARAMRGMEAAIAADARSRVRRGALEGPIRRVECDRFPRAPGAVGAEKDLTRSRGRWSCLAVRADFQGGELGHQYRLAADFRTGRYAFCKITGRAGPEREQIVTIPAECGGNSFK